MTKARDLATSGPSTGLVGIKPASAAVGSGSYTLTDTGITFSGASSVSLNDVFSATYENYKIIIKATGSGNADLKMLLRVSGSDAATNYNRQLLNADNTTVGGSRVTSQTNGFFVGYVNSTYASGSDMILFNPFLASATFVYSQYIQTNGAPQWTGNNGLHTTASAYDGFTISPASGTISGSVSIYGIKN